MQKGWVYEPVISMYEALLFYNAMKRHRDQYNYNPIAIARREQIGMKYRFLCIATPKTILCQPTNFADIEIYKPESGMPYATSLRRLDFDKMFYL
ncbi:MAG: hypothetical protein ACYDEX_12550 [Mobilitalea sp.]